jgi:hypothetical protein
VKKRALVVVLIALSTMLFSPPTHATNYQYTYTVHYICVISPTPPDPIGVWVLGCDGSWTGWGMQPGDGCTTYDVVQTECSGGGGGGGGNGCQHGCDP